MLEMGFDKASTDNLPKIDDLMTGAYFTDNPNFCSAEIRGVKNARSSRESYGEQAIGYVQVKRTGNLCELKGKMTPEHKVRKKAYNVSLICDEAEQKVLEVKCEDCAASAGGCKHAVAFLMWVHRRTTEPSTTEVKCYWKKSNLSHIGTSLKLKRTSAMSNRKSNRSVTDTTFLPIFLKKSKELNMKTQLPDFFRSKTNSEKLSLHQLIKESNVDENSDALFFMDYCKKQMTTAVCAEAALNTAEQSEEGLWFELRYARITASRAHEASNCKTSEGSLVETVLGSRRFKDNVALKRGRDLEEGVLKELGKVYKLNFSKPGLMLDPEYPVLGASPDGISKDYVVEIKCPMSEKTFQTYIKNNSPAARYYAQIQMQMFFAKKNKGIFCVAHPDFEVTKKLTALTIEYDNNFCINLMNRCNSFWSTSIYPKLFATLL